MNRQRLFNHTSPGGMTGSTSTSTPIPITKRILTPANNSSILDSDFHRRHHHRPLPPPSSPVMTTTTRTRTNLGHHNSSMPNLGMKQLSIHMKNLNNDQDSRLPPGFADVMGQISEISEGLYLCGAKGLKAPRISALGISLIINATVDLPNLQMDKVEFIRVAIEDSAVSNLMVYFDTIADKIDGVIRRGGKVLVHCMAGISRSASLCIAYLMKYRRLNLRASFREVKSKRSIVHPNPGFFRQLIEYEMRLFGTTSMSIVYNSPARRNQIEDTFESKFDNNNMNSSMKPATKYRTYITRPLELPIHLTYQKYSRQ